MESMSEDRDIDLTGFLTSGDFEDEIQAERMLKTLKEFEKDTKRRHLAFNVFDMNMEQSVHEFTKDRSYEKVFRGDLIKSRIFSGEWCRYVNYYYVTGKTDNMPSSFAPSSPFPVSYLVSVGDAGSGKSYSMANIHNTVPGVCVCAQENNPVDMYHSILSQRCQPGGYDYNMETKTLFRAFNLGFEKIENRNLLTQISEDVDIQRSFTHLQRMKNLDGNADIVEELTRNHVKRCLDNKSLHKLFRYMVKHELDRLAKHTLKCRMHRTDSADPFFQAEEETFPEVTMIMNLLYAAQERQDSNEDGDNCKEDESNDIDSYTQAVQAVLRQEEDYESKEKKSTSFYKRHDVRNNTTAALPSKYKKIVASPSKLTRNIEDMKVITDMDSYKKYMMKISAYSSNATSKGSNRKWTDAPDLPPMIMMNPIMIVEEDGKTQAFMLILHALISMAFKMIYNPPSLWTDPSFYFSSGSPTQSLVINFPVSSMDMLTASYSMTDVKNTMIWRSEFVRRNVDSLDSQQQKLRRVFCLAFERSLQPEPAIMAALYANECSPSLASDPGHHSSGSRLFLRHEDINNYNKESDRRGCANVSVDDIFYVACNVVVLRIEDPYLQSIPNAALSQLTSKQASRNRTEAFKEKVNTYKGTQLSGNVQGKKNAMPQSDRSGEQQIKDDLLGKIDTEDLSYNQERENILFDVGCNIRQERERICKARRSKRVAQLESQDAEPENVITRNNNDTTTDLYLEDEDIADFVAEAIRTEESNMNTTQSTDSHKNESNASQENDVLEPPRKTQRMNTLEDTFTQAFMQSSKNREEQDKDLDTDDDLIVTKKYVIGKATDFLSTQEHKERRTYARCIERYLGTGQELAKGYVNNNPKVMDHSGDLSYVPEMDIVVVYADPDYSQVTSNKHYLDKYAAQHFHDSVQSTTNSVQMYLAFRVRRKFVPNSPLKCLDKKAKVEVKGLDGSLEDILKSAVVKNINQSLRVVLLEQAILETLTTAMKANGVMLRTLSGQAVDRETLFSALDIACETLEHQSDFALSDLIQQYKDTTNTICLLQDGHLSRLKQKRNVNDPPSSESIEDDENNDLDTSMVLGNLQEQDNSNLILRTNEGVSVNWSHAEELYTRLGGKILCGEFMPFGQVPVKVYAKKSCINGFFHSSLKLKDMNLPDGSIQFKGNLNHELFDWERAKLRLFKNSNRTFQKEYGSEAHMIKKKFNVNETQMIQWGFKALFPEHELRTCMVMKISNVLIGCTRVNFSNSVGWRSVFVPPDQHPLRRKNTTLDFGLMTRRNQTVLGSSKIHSYHGMFPYPVGGNIGQLYPFVCGSVWKSDIIVKGREEVYYHSKNPYAGSNLPTRVQFMMDRSVLYYELYILIGGLCPFFPDNSSTVHGSQGSTRTNNVILDMHRLGVDSFVIDSVTSVLLVGVTRADDARNMQVVHPDAIQVVLFVKSKTPQKQEELVRKQELQQTLRSYEYFR